MFILTGINAVLDVIGAVMLCWEHKCCCSWRRLRTDVNMYDRRDSMCRTFALLHTHLCSSWYTGSVQLCTLFRIVFVHWYVLLSLADSSSSRNIDFASAVL